MEGIIKIDGQIGEYNGLTGVSLSDIIAQVRKQPESTSYRVLINSEGGRVDVGFDIYNYLLSLGLPLTTVGNGLVASIATVIFMAGSKRVVREGTLFMIHLPMGSTSGTVEEIESYTKAFKKVQNRVVNFYMEKFGMQKEAVEPLLKNQTWLNETQLQDLGITTDIPENIAAKAKINIDTEETKTHKKTNMSKSKEKSILEQMIALAKSAFEEAPTNKILLDAKTREVKFSELGKDALIKIGDQATIEDTAAQGEVVLQDGRTLTFENGKVTKITDPIDAPKEGDLEAVKVELEAVKAEKEAAVALNTTNAAKVKELEAKLSAKETILNSIMKLESEIEPKNPGAGTSQRDQQNGKASRAGAAIAKL